MKLQSTCVILLAALLWLPQITQAETLALPENLKAEDLKPDFPQPYVVKKGDTLWDISAHFFKDPEKWVLIWEKNLQITNPDLIYPGNEIWFRKPEALPQTVQVDGETPVVPAQPEAYLVRPHPEVIAKPVEKLEAKVDPRLLLTALARQDFIQPNAVEGVGYILDSEDDRLNYGANDFIYLHLDTEAGEGDTFDIFRTGDPILDPKTRKQVGVLVNHVGQVEIISQRDGIYRAVVLNAFEEITRSDRLKPAKAIDSHIAPTYPAGELVGQVLYIRNDAAEAGQNQIIGISMGLKDGLKPGSALSIHRKGRIVPDKVTGGKAQLPEEKIGELLVLVPQQDASIALVTESTSSINRGDAVRNQANH